MRLKFITLFALCLILFLPTAFSQTIEQKVLTLAEAQLMMAAAEKRAKQDNWNVVISIVDAGGHLICLHRMDGAQIGSVEVSQKKALASVLFKRPTKAFEDAINGGNNGILLLPNVIASEGGVPIVHEGKVIGAIGVSGVTSAQDGIIANAALKVF
ncbi:MAG TPA: heme-binding protein [Cyclobacteriaceae bacterium]|nr:heme-binding protein [Cyclobacteriaceae bacterium]